MAASSYARLKSDISAQVIEIKNNSLTVQFETQQVMYEPESDKVFIAGKTQTSGVAGRLSKESRVYEIKVDMANGRPVITDLQAYVGEARTVAILEKMETRRVAEEERVAKLNRNK